MGGDEADELGGPLGAVGPVAEHRRQPRRADARSRPGRAPTGRSDRGGRPDRRSSRPRSWARPDRGRRRSRRSCTRSRGRRAPRRPPRRRCCGPRTASRLGRRRGAGRRWPRRGRRSRRAVEADGSATTSGSGRTTTVPPDRPLADVVVRLADERQLDAPRRGTRRSSGPAAPHRSSAERAVARAGRSRRARAPRTARPRTTGRRCRSGGRSAGSGSPRRRAGHEGVLDRRGGGAPDAHRPARSRSRTPCRDRPVQAAAPTIAARSVGPSSAAGTRNRRASPTTSPTVRAPIAASSRRRSSATARAYRSTCSGVPLNFARRSGRCVAIPVGHVSRWHWRAMSQPRATSAAVPNPNSSAPSRAATRRSRPTWSPPSVAEHDPVAQPVPEERLVDLGETELPGRPGVLDRAERARARCPRRARPGGRSRPRP